MVKKSYTSPLIFLPKLSQRDIRKGLRSGCGHKFNLPRCANDFIVHRQKKFVLPLGSEVIKLFVMIVGQISKFKFKYATGVRHSVTGSVGWMLKDA
jgi:hypothetical protein